MTDRDVVFPHRKLGFVADDFVKMPSSGASAQRGLHVGARFCLASDSARRGVVESQGGGGYFTVRFTDKSRNIHIRDLKVLPSDGPTFEPSQASPSGEERQKEERATTMAARAIHVGAHVCLASDSARLGIVESQGGGGHWIVRFADMSRNIHIKDLEVLPSEDATFEPSQAPPGWAESRQEERATAIVKRGVHIGARACLVSDSARRGVVEAQAGGNYWAVRFADKSRNIRFDDLKGLSSEDATFEPSQAPPSKSEKQQEKQETIIAARAVQAGARVCLASDSARRGVVESCVAPGGYWAVRFADKSRNIRVKDLEVLPSDEATFEPSLAPPSSAVKKQEVTTMAARGVHIGAHVCLASDSARRGVVESQIAGGYWAVRFADTSRNIRANDLVVLPSDEVTYEPSLAPPKAKKSKRETWEKSSAVNRTLKAATPPAAALSRKRRAGGASDVDAGDAAAAAASDDGEELGDGASDDEPQVKRL